VRTKSWRKIIANEAGLPPPDEMGPQILTVGGHWAGHGKINIFPTRSDHIFGNDSPTQRPIDSIDASFESPNYCASTGAQ
jgi:hypothetical protein